MESHIENSNSFTFHRNEIAFCGYSGSGKTTLISKIVNALSASYKTGYIKHDAHFFNIDHEGKDTFNVKQSGACGVMINDRNHWSVNMDGIPDRRIITEIFSPMDIVLIEGYKQSKIPKICVLDAEGKMLEEICENKFSNVCAIAGADETLHPSLRYPYFNRDNTTGIITFIKGLLRLTS